MLALDQHIGTDSKSDMLPLAGLADRAKVSTQSFVYNDPNFYL